MAVRDKDDRTAGPAGIAGLLNKRMTRKRATMRTVIIVERVWPLVLPVLCIVALFVALSWFGYFHAVPGWLRIVTLAAFIAGLVWALVSLRHLRFPDEAAVDRRLERVNRIAHQALAVQDDRLENETGFSRALWLEHRRRMAESIADLRTGMPEPDTPRRDPYGLRALVALLLVTAFAYSYSNRAGFLSDAFTVATPGQAGAPVRVDAWITPPAYTGRAPIFLTRADTALPDRFSVPQGSEVTVRVSGGNAAKVTYQADDTSKPAALEPKASRTAEASKAAPVTGGDAGMDTKTDVQAHAATYVFKPATTGTLSVDGDGPSKRWTFDIVADHAPRIAFAGDPKSTSAGALKLNYSVKDDYGVTKAHAVIAPADPPAPDTHPLYGAPEFPLTLPGAGVRSGKATASRDLTENPLAGQRVRITLVATDGAGQIGRSKTIETTMPAKFFSEPLSRAVVEQRRTFALDTHKLPRALDLADALTTAPEKTIDDATRYLVLRSARQRMALAFDDDTLRDAADYLWQIALSFENGNLSLAQQRLRDAQRALSQALKNNAPDDEIARLMQKLRQAMNDMMREMAKQAQKNPQTAELPPDAQVLRQQDLQRMMDQIENLARSGQRQQAEQLLSQLQQMMNNLQAARPQQGRQGNDSAMRKQMDKLGNLLQQQQALMNQTFQLNRQLQNRLRRQEQGPQQQQNGKQGQQGKQGQPMTADQLRQALKELRRQQQNLKNQLGQLQKGMKSLGMNPGKGFGKAGQAMGNASGALGKGQGERALGEQGRALQALRDGARSMMSQMQKAMGNRRGPGQGQARGDRMGRNNRDPLGRLRSSSGPEFGDQVKVPDEIDIQRAREILNQIRKRLGNNLSPAVEKKYLERLLDMQ